MTTPSKRAEPRITLNEDILTVEFQVQAKSASVIDIDLIVDFNSYSEPIGIEIIGLKHQIGFKGSIKLLWSSLKSDVTNYDAEVDCLTVSIMADRSIDQYPFRGQVTLNEEGLIEQIVISLSKYVAACGSR